MAGSHCFSVLQLCRLRIAVLEPNGVPDPGSRTLFVTDAAINLGVNFEVKAGSSFELVNGCGEVCATFEDCDKIKSVGLSLNLCHLDTELVTAMTGANDFLVSTETVGFQLPDVNDACSNGVSVEGWMKAWDSEQQGEYQGDLAHWRVGFPKTTWRLGNITFENNFAQIPLVGKGVANANFSDGPANDWPQDLVQPFGIFLDPDPLPVASCGGQTLSAS